MHLDYISTTNLVENFENYWSFIIGYYSKLLKLKSFFASNSQKSVAESLSMNMNIFVF